MWVGGRGVGGGVSRCVHVLGLSLMYFLLCESHSLFWVKGVVTSSPLCLFSRLWKHSILYFSYKAVKCSSTQHGLWSQMIRVESTLCHLLAVWPLARYFVSPCLCFVSCQMGLCEHWMNLYPWSAWDSVCLTVALHELSAVIVVVIVSVVERLVSLLEGLWAYCFKSSLL